jgi:Transposase zinc-ribbon domain
MRWPDGFVCPVCGGGKAWRLETKAWTYECASCGRQTSVTAGTIMHHSKLPLTAWFWAAYLMATHSNGISALQLQRQLAFGSYKTAWLICAKLRCSMLGRAAAPWPASSRSMKPKSRAAAKMTRSLAVAGAVIRAKC